MVRITGLLVVVMKALMAARKPTSSSNMTSTCWSRKKIKFQNESAEFRSVQMHDLYWCRRFLYLFKQDEWRGRLSALRRRLLTVLQRVGCQFPAVRFSRPWNARNVKVICFLVYLEVVSQSDSGWFSFGSSATAWARVPSCLSFQGKRATSRKLLSSC